MYRAFAVTPAGGYGGWFEIAEPSDEAAMAAARLQTNRMPVDVWCGGRFVGRIEHGDVETNGSRVGGWSEADNAA